MYSTDFSHPRVHGKEWPASRRNWYLRAIGLSFALHDANCIRNTRIRLKPCGPDVVEGAEGVVLLMMRERELEELCIGDRDDAVVTAVDDRDRNRDLRQQAGQHR